MTMQDVSVHVEHLVLEGIDPSDRYAVARALQAELGRALAERGVAGWLADAGGAERVDGGDLVLPRHAAASAVGSGAGAYVARALAGRGEP
ncbi:MAG TPA: hypothetical protein VK420_01190 [Longimicrobium sp.]|jgi:hypothetical protein|nr:hypothetical protein [Longimicrobium sp.]